jgi:MOSC domain-containing protein
VAASVLELWRYPVKSLLGERLDEVELDERGVVGDRLFAVTDRDGKLGSGKTTTRFRLLQGLFELRARSDGERPLVSLPDGTELRVGDPRLDRFLSERYGDELRVLEESTVPHHDDAPLHLLTTASVRWLAAQLPRSVVDGRRFRPNILLEAGGSEVVEDRWVGARFRLGGAMIRILDRSERCVMTTNAQEDLPKDPAVLRAVTKLNDACLGVFAAVEQPGRIRVGEVLQPL